MICELLPAVTLPSGLNDGFSLASASTVVSGRIPSSTVTRSSGLGDRCRSPCPCAWSVTGQDLALEATLGGGPGRVLLAAGAEAVEVLPGQVPLVGDQLGRDALRHQPADRLRSARRPSGRTGQPTPWPMLARPSGPGS